MGYTKSMNRIEIYDDLTEDEVKQIASMSDIKYIQMSSMVSLKALEMINIYILERNKAVQFRVYGFIGLECDLSFMEVLSNVVDLSIGEMDTANNLEVLKKLTNLKKLRINLNKLNDLNFLNGVKDDITYLMLGTGINNSKLNIEIIQRFKLLNTLFLYKINFGFEILAKIKSLENLTLNACKIKNLSLLNNTNIISLSIGLDNYNDCVELYGNSKITRLELTKLKKLVNLEILSKLPSLEYAKISQMSNIEKIPDLKNCDSIKMLIFDDLKNLSDIVNLSTLPNVQCIELYQAKSIKVNDIETILEKLVSLQCMKCHSGNIKTDLIINDILKKYKLKRD